MKFSSLQIQAFFDRARRMLLRMRPDLEGATHAEIERQLGAIAGYKKRENQQRNANYWRTGQRMIPLHAALRLAAEFEVSLDWLLLGRGVPGIPGRSTDISEITALLEEMPEEGRKQVFTYARYVLDSERQASDFRSFPAEAKQIHPLKVPEK